MPTFSCWHCSASDNRLSACSSKPCWPRAAANCGASSARFSTSISRRRIATFSRCDCSASPSRPKACSTSPRSPRAAARSFCSSSPVLPLDQAAADRDRLPLAWLRLGKPPQRLQHEPEIPQPRGEIFGELAPLLDLDQPAADRDILALAGLRLVQPAEAAQHHAMIAEGRRQSVGQLAALLDLDQAAADRHALPLAGLGFPQVSQRLEQQPVVVQGRGKMAGELDPLLHLHQPAADRDILALAGLRLAEPPERAQHQPMVAERRRQSVGQPAALLHLDQPAADRDILALAGFRLGQPPERLQRRAVIAERRRQMARQLAALLHFDQPAADGDALPVALLRFHEPAQRAQHQAVIVQRRRQRVRQPCPLLDQLAADLDILPLAGLRLGRPAEGLQHQPVIAQRGRERIGELAAVLDLDQPAADGDAFALAGFRLHQPSQRAQHQAMIVQRRRQRAREAGPRLPFDQLGAERDILALAGFRLGEPAEPLQDRAMIAQSRREMAGRQEMVGQPRPRLDRCQPAPDRDILALAGFGLGEPAEGLQHQAEMRQRRGEGLCQLGAALAFDGLAQSLGAEAQDRFRPPPALGLEEAAAIGGQRQQSANAPLGRDRSGRGGSGFSGAGLMSEHEAGIVEIGLVVDAEGIPMPGMAVLDHRGDAAMSRCEERRQDGIARDEGGKLVMGDAVARLAIAVVHPIVPGPAPHLLDDVGKLEEDAVQPVAAQAPALDLIDRDRGLRRAEEQEQRPVDALIEHVADALPQRLEIGRIEAVGRWQLVDLPGGRHQGGGPQGLDQMRQIAEGAARLLHHPAGERFAPEMGGQPRHRIAGQQRAVFGRRRLQAQRPIAPLAARGAERGQSAGRCPGAARRRPVSRIRQPGGRSPAGIRKSASENCPSSWEGSSSNPSRMRISRAAPLACMSVARNSRNCARKPSAVWSLLWISWTRAGTAPAPHRPEA